MIAITMITYHNLGQLLLSFVNACHIKEGDAGCSLGLLVMPSSSAALWQLQGQLIQGTQKQPNVQNIHLHSATVCCVLLTADWCTAVGAAHERGLLTSKVAEALSSTHRLASRSPLLRAKKQCTIGHCMHSLVYRYPA